MPSLQLTTLLKRCAGRCVAGWRELRFRLLMNALKGGIDLPEALFLRRLGASVAGGDLLEVGSFRGKSALALYAGMAHQSGNTPMLYCIEPHRAFVGIYGGRFGPRDRAGFYRNMLLSGAYRGVALINLASCEAARGWQRPLGLLFIDGDHTYEGVTEDVRHWTPHLLPGGLLIFDDARDERIGPQRVIRELIAVGGYRQECAVGKIVALRKLPATELPAPPTATAKQRILIVTNALYLSGGLLRFERAGRALIQQGHAVAFCVLQTGERPVGWTGRVPVIDLTEAWQQEWDVTMLPGRAGIDTAGRSAWLRAFTDRRFGLRIQHILNDRTYETAFLALNREFLPHLVVFNNTAWEPGSFVQFTANEFHVLTGGVDWQAFAACRPHVRSGRADEIVVGGQARKNPWPLIACLDLLPARYRLCLFGGVPDEVVQACQPYLATGRIKLCGTLAENELPGYYAGIDVVVATEEHAGWSNLTAEAMAAGIPVICTPAGTTLIARDGETARVIPRPDPQLIAAALEELWADTPRREALAARAQQQIRSFGWENYACGLLALTTRGRSAHYYCEPQLGMFGKWPACERLTGLASLFVDIAGKSVLDVGAAEGVLAKACLDAGATRVDGLDIDAGRIDKARTLCGDAATFFVADLNDAPGILQDGPLQATYDIVLYLGIHHHLDAAVRTEQLRQIVALCGKTLALRTSCAVNEEDALQTIMQSEGFVLAQETHEGMPGMGSLWIYTKQ